VFRLFPRAAAFSTAFPRYRLNCRYETQQNFASRIFGLFNFLGGRKKQLIVGGYSGGAHCCWQYRIDSPFPPVIFKYNHRAGKYLPANRLFQSRVTEGIEAKITTIAEWNKTPELEKRTSLLEPEYAATSLDILLRFLYAGQERRAWDFFNENYRLSDKQEMKLDTEKKLRGCVIYQYLYRRGR